MESEVQKASDGVDWKLFGVLMCAGLLAALAVVPYLIEISRAEGKQVDAWELTVSTALEHIILLAIAICIGQILGPRVGLGTPILSDFLAGKPEWANHSRLALVAALLGGIGTGLVIAVLDPWLETLMPEWPESARQAEQAAEKMASWKPLLASFSAGVTEELLFRFGLMTLFVWLGIKLTRRGTPGTLLLWMANLLAALLFSLAHLANVVELEIAITPGTILYVIITNGIGGVVFGWLYFRHGLTSAILAHMLADVVLNVAIPIVTSMFA